MYDILGLLALRHSRWGWIVALVVLVVVLVWFVMTIVGSQPDVSGPPRQIAARWNRASLGVPITAEGRAIRATFAKNLQALHVALTRDDEDAADDARDRIANDFRALGRLRVRHGLSE